MPGLYSSRSPWRLFETPERRALAAVVAVAFVSGSIGFAVGRISMSFASSTSVEREASPGQQVGAAPRQAEAAPDSKPRTGAQKQSATEPVAEVTAKTSDQPIVLLNPQSGSAAKGNEPAKASPATEDGTQKSSAAAWMGTMGHAQQPSPDSGAQTSGVAEKDLSSEPVPAPEAHSQAERKPAAFADLDALARCEGRYRSFRRSDGTYQPYDGGSRRFCPYLQ